MVPACQQTIAQKPKNLTAQRNQFQVRLRGQYQTHSSQFWGLFEHFKLERASAQFLQAYILYDFNAFIACCRPIQCNDGVTSIGCMAVHFSQNWTENKRKPHNHFKERGIVNSEATDRLQHVRSQTRMSRLQEERFASGNCAATASEPLKIDRHRQCQGRSKIKVQYANWGPIEALQQHNIGIERGERVMQHQFLAVQPYRPTRRMTPTGQTE